MNNIIFPFLISVYSMLSISPCEELTCTDFKLGSFQIILEGDSESYYSIDRSNVNQIETNEFGDEVYYTVKWIDECTYIQRFDKKKMSLTDEMKMVNGDGGMVVELLEVKNDNSISFRSYVKNFKELSLTYGEFRRIDK